MKNHNYLGVIPFVYFSDPDTLLYREDFWEKSNEKYQILNKYIKKNVDDFRILIGATNPAQAAEGTIRKLFAASIGENAIHGSDSDANALIEGDFFFNKLEQF